MANIIDHNKRCCFYKIENLLRIKFACTFATFGYETFENVAKLQYLGTTSADQK
jgi:hypothetical protein